MLRGGAPRQSAALVISRHCAFNAHGLHNACSPPLRYQYEPSESEGVDFIIAAAMASTPEAPLWVIGLGAATDIGSGQAVTVIDPPCVGRLRPRRSPRRDWLQLSLNTELSGSGFAKASWPRKLDAALRKG